MGRLADWAQRTTASKKQVQTIVVDKIPTLEERNKLYLKIETLLNDVCRAAEIAEDASIEEKEYTDFVVCQLSAMIRDLREVYTAGHRFRRSAR